MKQAIFEELTVCIPIRIDSKERYDNLQFVINYFTDNTNIPMFIVEGDSTKKVVFKNDIPDLTYKFIEDHNPVFHRTHYINMMLSSVHTKYAAIWDADIIVPVAQLYDALKVFGKHQCTMVLPHDGRCHYVPPFFSDYVKEHNDYSALCQYHELMQLMNGYKVVGGAFMVDVAKYKIAGWENEYFTGWGPEDAERVRRLYILGEHVHKIPGEMFHLYHPIFPMENEDERNGTKYITKKEYCHVCSMNQEELKRYISTWPWLEST